MDVASWSALWDYNLISNSRVDRIFVMSTYTSNFTSFARALNTAVEKISLQKLGVGLETDNGPYSEEELQQR